MFNNLETKYYNIVEDCIFDRENNVNNSVFLEHSSVLVKTKDLIK